MIAVPVIHPRYRAWMLPDCVFLMSEDDAILLQGRAYLLLVPLIDGERDRDALLRAVEGQCAPGTAARALDRMEERRYILEASAVAAAQAPAEVFWQAQGIDPAQARARLRATRVSVHAVGAADPAPVAEALAATGVQIVADGGLAVVLTDDYARPELLAWSRASLDSGAPWLVAKPAGTALWLGPLFVPGQTGCLECLRQRIVLRRPVESLVRRRRATDEPVAPARRHLPGQAQAAAGLIAEAVRQFALTGRHPLVGQAFTLAPVTFESRLHPLTRRPQCAACGEPQAFAGEPAPFDLRSARTTVADDSGTRSLPAEELVRRFDHHVSPITGIVGGIVPLGDPDDPTRVYGSSYNHAFTHDDLHYFRMHVRSSAGGKGSTDLQARASALGEALERYSGLFQGYEPTRVATYEALGEAAVHPALLTGFSPAQYAARQATNAVSTGKNLVPAPLDPVAPMHWSPVWSVSAGRRRYVPTSFCYYGFVLEDRSRTVCFADSNGCAGGATKEDALLQGLMELVERDAVGMWWYNRAVRPGIDLDRVDHPHIRRVRAYHAEKGRHLWALDLTADSGIPVAAAVSAAADGTVGDVAVGFAAHLDPLIALRRAVNECGQTTAALRRLRQEGGVSDELTMAWLRGVDPQRERYLRPSEGERPVVLAERASLTTGDAADDVRAAVGRLEGLGLEVLVLDQTRPDCGYPVVKAIVPGLCHFWPRFGLTRLYEAPVRMGWLSAPRGEAEMNPLPMLL